MQQGGAPMQTLHDAGKVNERKRLPRNAAVAPSVPPVRTAMSGRCRCLGAGPRVRIAAAGGVFVAASFVGRRFAPADLHPADLHPAAYARGRMCSRRCADANVAGCRKSE
jgi:hypothetical protein